nr:MAG TPA: hypothetical protein [Caudoviricetes sp.]
MIAIMLDIKCCSSGASRLLVDDSSRQHSNGVRFILPRAHSRITTTERALANQARRLFTIIDSVLLPVVCPLLITPDAVRRICLQGIGIPC